LVQISHLDHLVLTVASIERSSSFYARVLGMMPERFGTAEVPRHALKFGTQKINLHQVGAVVDRNVRHATPGSADLCLITVTPIDAVIAHLKQCNVPLIEGPVKRTGANGPIMSVYFYDPDENLIEVANQLVSATVSERARR
jgi:catechol 2,3-dioxygenase-like lactoylglutathione lyase family enzyme